jgi:hypothetical protein
MRKKGITLSFSVVIGLVIGVVILLFIVSVGYKYVNTYLTSESDNRALENSIELLKEEIMELENGQRTDIHFKAVERDIFLGAFNSEQHGIKECFNVACLAICNDILCEDDFFPQDLEGITFETTGEVVSLDKSRDIPIILEIIKDNGMVSIQELQK